MKSSKYSWLGALALSVVLAACDDETPIESEPATGGTGGSGGAGGSSGSAGSGGGANGGSKTECPTGLAGAKLVRLPGSEQGSYFCMDEREVVYAEYKEFLDAMGGSLPEQPAECKANSSLTPDLWQEDDPPIGCHVSAWKIDTQPDFAVNCVDFCDAFAYCKWAGKRLCGEQGKSGATVNMFADVDAYSAVAGTTKSEWFSACSQNGKSKYPYGDEYIAGQCVDLTKFTAQGDEALVTKDIASDGCRGTESPYDAVHHLSGNVDEWTNLCHSGGECQTAGGSYGETGAALACGYPGTPSWPTNHPYTGFRCCADPIAQ